VHERAKAYQAIEWHTDALNDFNQVITMNPANAHAFFRRAFSFLSIGEFKRATVDFEQAVKLDPLNPALVVNYKQVKDVKFIVLCEPGDEPQFPDKAKTDSDLQRLGTIESV
jgi:tetratricopeptide (TPR) repeat protein